MIGVLSHEGLDGDEHRGDALGWAPGGASPRPAKHSRGREEGEAKCLGEATTERRVHQHPGAWQHPLSESTFLFHY